jgi:VanZ family protein
LTTYPVEIGEAIAPEGLYFPVSKTLHVCAYAFLTVFITWLPMRRWRWWLLAFLSLHAAGTEFGQLFIPGRTGRLADVFIDHIGLFLGLVFTWKRWIPRSVRRHSAPYNPRQAGGYRKERITSSLP